MAPPARVVQLRPLRRNDVERLAGWLPDVAKDAGCDRWANGDALARALGDECVLVPRAGDAFIAYDAGLPDRRSATVSLLAVPPGERRLGTGGRVALALEARLARSIDRIYTIVPARIGLALYFWLRLGYRPLTQGEWPAEPEDKPSAWMVRELR